MAERGTQEIRAELAVERAGLESALLELRAGIAAARREVGSKAAAGGALAVAALAARRLARRRRG